MSPPTKTSSPGTKLAKPKRSDLKILTLRSIEDLRGGADLDRIINLNTLYGMAIDNGHDQHVQRSGHWHPSAVGMCKRGQVLQFIGTKPTDRQSKSVRELFDLGHAVHDIVQSQLEALAPVLEPMGLQYTFQREVPYDPATDQLFLSMHIGGTCDGVLRIWGASFEQRSVVEIKSQSDERFKELERSETALPNHLMQAHIYAYRFDTPIIYVFYKNKNNGKREVRLHLFEQRILDAAITYFDECSGYVHSGELPPRQESYFECKECVYRSMCDPLILKRDRRPALPAKKIRR